MRPFALSTLVCTLAVGVTACAKPKDSSGDKSAAQDKATPDSKRKAPTKLPTALPQARPTPFEAEYRIRAGTKNNASSMIKATDKGARFSIGDDEHRVIVSYDIGTQVLDDVYVALRDAAFDRIETQATRQIQPGGTSMTMLAGTQRHSASDMGRIYPKEHWADAYDAAAKAMETLLPPKPGASVAAAIAVRWDASMQGHRATIDAALGARFAGVESVDDTGANARIGLKDPAPVTLELRHGPPAVQDEHAFDPAKHAAVIVSYDTEGGHPVARLVDEKGLNAWDAAAKSAAATPAKAPSPAPKGETDPG